MCVVGDVRRHELRASRGVRRAAEAVLRRRAFFFSSRRRHTRYIGDWSSDVCSSDLFLNANYIRFMATNPLKTALLTNRVNAEFGRSEERRVGKECRARWSRCY